MIEAFVIGLFLGVLSIAFWICMLVDSKKRKFKEESNRIMWILLIIFTGIIGAFIYYYTIYMKSKETSKLTKRLVKLFFVILALTIFSLLILQLIKLLL